MMNMTYVDHIIQRTMLSNRHKNRLVVFRGIDGSQTENTRSKTRSNRNGKNTVRVRGGVNTLEECELGGVGRGGLLQTGDLFDDEVRVTDDLTSCVKLLGR